MTVLLLGGRAAGAEPVWVAARMLHKGEILAATDAAPGTPAMVPFDALPASSPVVGLEARTTIYAGRALRGRDVGQPYLVHVSAPVDVTWSAGGLTLELSGRALDSGAMGDPVRVLNPATSRTIQARVTGENRAEANGTP